MTYPKDRPNPPAHVAHFTTHGTIAGTAWANSFWVRNGQAAAPTEAQFADYVADMHANWIARFIEHVNDEVRILGTQGLYYGATGADLGFAYSKVDTGSMSGARLPASISTGISWQVQAHYKGGHPRTYLPPPAAAAMADGRLLTSAHTDAVRAAANQFLSAVPPITHGNFANGHLGTVSFVLRKAWRDPPVFRDFVAGAATVDNRIDTQRRRLGRDL